MFNDKADETETGLGSISKLKILRILTRNKDETFTKYALEKMTGLKSIAVRNNLKTLTQIQWVKEYLYKPKKYKINLENPVVKHLIAFFREVKYI